MNRNWFTLRLSFAICCLVRFIFLKNRLFLDFIIENFSSFVIFLTIFEKYEKKSRKNMVINAKRVVPVLRNDKQNLRNSDVRRSC